MGYKLGLAARNLCELALKQRGRLWKRERAAKKPLALDG